MKRLALLLAALCLTSCQTAPAPVRQEAVTKLEEGWEKHKAVVIVAVDIREKTSLRDNIPHFGSVFFRRADRAYAGRASDDYDFGIQYSLASDWRAAAGQRDENRAPRLFQLEPGVYVIERINIGSRPKTIRQGYDASTNRVSYGHFDARAGDVINLGRLVVHMHYHEGTFSQRVEDNSKEVLEYVADKYPGLKKPETRLLNVTPKFEFDFR